MTNHMRKALILTFAVPMLICCQKRNGESTTECSTKNLPTTAELPPKAQSSECLKTGYGATGDSIPPAPLSGGEGYSEYVFPYTTAKCHYRYLDTTFTSVDTSVAHKCLTPIKECLSLDNGTVQATFTDRQFDWKRGTLTFTIGTFDRFDACEVHTLTVGDTIQLESKRLSVKTIHATREKISFSTGDNDWEQYTLKPYDRGSYYIYENYLGRSFMSDYGGQFTLSLASDFMLIDGNCRPIGEEDTIRVDFQDYLNRQNDSGKLFLAGYTTLKIVNGQITEIFRRYTP